ncbi:hypothetical protein LSH36_330g03033 [Paralvinella palmiformis]|uniref:Uncharacterized protein n=1 Tax=Paralvinella palmiformis TaxID=53620 RepID=A0AAD9JFV5_9ANNE|nr:hypothetical protein LSH36_330g03033 [Paralvinella palmiformis]
MDSKGRCETETRRPPCREASRRQSACRMAAYLTQLADEKATKADATTLTWSTYVRRLTTTIVNRALRISSRLSEHFDRPADCRRGVDFVEEVQFGPQNGLSPGSAICRLNAAMNAEEQSISRREWRRCLSDDVYLSAETIFPWFSQELFRVLDILKEQNYEHEFTDAIFWKLFPGVQLFLPIPNKIPKPSEKPHFGLVADSQIEVLFVPCIKGSGWPGGVKMQHPFPRQKPFVAKGTESLRHLAQLVEDGQGYALWILEPVLKQTSNSSSAFWLSRKSGILGKPDPTANRLPLWRVSLRPAIRILKGDLTSGLKDTGFGRDVDIGVILSLVRFFRAQHDWLIFENEVVDSAIMHTVKRHLVNTRTTSAMFLKVVAFLGKVARTRSCPAFLMPNLNILRISDADEAEEVATNIQAFLSAIEQDETHLLKYLGYKSRTERLHEKRRKHLETT